MVGVRGFEPPAPPPESARAFPRLAGDRVFLPTRGGAETRLNLKKFLPSIIKLAELPPDITAHVRPEGQE